MIAQLNFKNLVLIEQALTHRSATRVDAIGTSQPNERLEFLGDAVLELATTEFLFKKYPKHNEGELTAYRSALVKTTMLAEICQEIGLDKKIYMSRGEENSGGRENPHLLADALEAVIGALYLDQGYQKVYNFLEEILFPKINQVIAQKSYKDAKSVLQEQVQAQGLTTPVYEVASEIGPDHDKKFIIRVLVDNQELATGSGKSKQQAQQEAAQNALEKIVLSK